MKTTIAINNELHKQAKIHPIKRGCTLSSLVEQALAQMLAEPKPKRKMPRIELPISKARGGLLPGVDLIEACRGW